MQVLVTGGSGFIGGYLVDELQGQGYDVRVMSRNPGQLSEDDGGTAACYGDITKPETLDTAVQDVDLVFHNAAIAADHGPAERFQRVNVQGTKNVLDACHSAGVERLVYTSSAGVYGFPDSETPIIETSEKRPMNAYQRSKLQGERLVLQQDDIEVVAVRPPLVLGPGSPAAPLLLSRLAEQKLPFFGPGDNLISLAHPRDVARCLWLVASRGGDAEVYNAVSFACTVQRLFEELADRLGVQPPQRHLPYPLAYAAAVLAEWMARLRSDEPTLTRFRVMQFGTSRDIRSDKAMRELGFTPKWDLAAMADDLVSWYHDRDER